SSWEHPRSPKMSPSTNPTILSSFSSYAFRYAEFCASGPIVPGNFFRWGHDQFPHLFKRDLDIPIKVPFWLPLKVSRLDKALHQTVLQGMVTDQGQPAPGHQQFGHLEQELPKGLQFLIHLDPNGLVDLCQDLVFPHLGKKLPQG